MAGTDTATFATSWVGDNTLTLDVLANDTDPDGDTLTASGGGTWYLDGDLQPAGNFTVDEDGTMTIDIGTDPLGPVQQLLDGMEWSATLLYTVSDGTETAFISSAHVPYVVTLNSGWGFGSSASVRYTAVPFVDLPARSQTINFFVGDAGGAPWSSGGVDPVPSCSLQSGRPYTPYVGLPTLDLRTVEGDTVTFSGNALVEVIEPYERPVTGGGQGYFGDSSNPYGIYRIHPDGSVTLTLDPDNPIPEGQYVGQDVPYRAVGPDGNMGVGPLGLSVLGRG